MTFEIGDKVQTNTGLYMRGEWREAGRKGKVVEALNSMGALTVKFKGLDELRFIRPEYLELRKKAKAEEVEPEVEEVKVPAGYGAEDESLIVPGAKIVVTEIVETNDNYIEEHTTGVIQSVDTEDEQAVVKLTDVGASWSYTDTLSFDEFTVVGEAPKAEHSPEVLDALALVLERIEEIKTLLTAKPQHEFHIYTNEASFVTPEKEEEPEPEPVFKKAKEVQAGDSMYTEAGVWDKVNRIETKDSGYTSLYGVFGNKIAQVPSGRVVQVLEPVS